MRHRLKLIAGALVLIAALAFVFHAVFAPKVLRVAVGPLGGSEMRVVVAFLQALQRERSSVRLKLVLTEDTSASAKALSSGLADLAVVRSDAGLPTQSATVAILRREAVYIITRPGAGIRRMEDLRGKTVGLVGPRPTNEAILKTILSQYDVPEAEVKRLAIPSPELMLAVQEGRIDAVFMVAPTSARMSRMAYQGFAREDGKSPGLLAVSDADALVEQNPAFDTVEIVRGAFGTSPALPDTAVTTLAVTHRLVARRSLDESVISEVTRLLIALRLQIAVEAPAANQIELPSTEDRAAKLPVHPGTIAYVEGETKTFFDRYGDWLWFGIMGISLFGSAVTALFSRQIGQGASLKPDELLRALVVIIEAARQAETRSALETIERESQKIIADLLRSMTDQAADSTRIVAISVLLGEFRHVLDERRQAFVQLSVSMQSAS